MMSKISLALLLLRWSAASAFLAPSFTQSYATTTQLNHQQSITFDEMKSIESRLITLEKQAPEILSDFYEPHLKSFSVRPGSTDSLSVTSTCFALQSIAAGGRDKFDDFVDFNMKQSADMSSNKSGVSTTTTNKVVPMRGVIKAVLRANWRDEDMFQVPLLLSTVLQIDSDRSILNSYMDEELSHRVKQLIVATMDSRPKVRKYKFDEYT